MSWYLSSYNLEHLRRAAGGELGTGGPEAWAAAREDFVRNHLSNSARLAELEIAREQRERARTAGIDLPALPEGDVDSLIAARATDRMIDQARHAVGRFERRRLPPGAEGTAPGDLPPRPGAGRVAELRQMYDEQVARYNAARGLDPNPGDPLMTLADMRAEALRRARDARARRDDVSRRSAHLGADIMMFVGDLTGAIQDPVNIVASVAAAPTAARGLLRLVLAEAGINMAAESFVQTAVVPWLEEQGVPREDALRMAAENVAFAAALGAIIGGGIGAAVKGTGAVRGRRLRTALEKLAEEPDAAAIAAVVRAATEQGIVPARVMGRVVAAARRGRRGEMLEAVVEALERSQRDLPADVLGLIDAMRDAALLERTMPTAADGVQPLRAHARNVADADDAIRSGRMPEPVAVEGPPVAARAAARAAGAETEMRGPDIRLGAGPVAFRETPDGPRPVVPRDFVPTDHALAAARELRRGTPAAERPETLTEFVRRAGGLDIDADEVSFLRAQDVGNPRGGLPGERGGFPLLTRKRKGTGFNRGRSFDDMREAAADAGFLGPDPDRATIDDFVEALIADATGRRRVTRPDEAVLAEGQRELAEQVEALAELYDIHADRLSERELAFLLDQDLDALRLRKLQRRIDALDEEESLEAALLIARDQDAAIRAEYEAAIEAQARRREGFEPDLEADPETVLRSRTEREITLDELEALHADLARAEARGSADPRPAETDGPGARGAAPSAQRAGAEPAGPAAAREGPGARDAGREATQGVAGREATQGVAGREATQGVAGGVPEHGPHGPIFREYRHDATGAIYRLLRVRDGEAVAALRHREVGDIDLVWGEPGTGPADGFGLAKIARLHPEVLDDLQGILDGLPVISRSDNRVRFSDGEHFAAVSLNFRGTEKVWLLTAFRRGAGPGGTMDGAGIAGGPTSSSTTGLGPDIGAANAVRNPAGLPDSAAVPKRDEGWVARLEAFAAEVDARLVDARARLDALDMDDLRARAAGGEPGARQLADLIDEAEAVDPAWGAMLACLTEAV